MGRACQTLGVQPYLMEASSNPGYNRAPSFHPTACSKTVSGRPALLFNLIYLPDFATYCGSLLKKIVINCSNLSATVETFGIFKKNCMWFSFPDKAMQKSCKVYAWYYFSSPKVSFWISQTAYCSC